MQNTRTQPGKGIRTRLGFCLQALKQIHTCIFTRLHMYINMDQPKKYKYVYTQYSSLSLSFYLSFFLSFFISFYMSVYLSIYLSVYLSVYLRRLVFYRHVGALHITGAGARNLMGFHESWVQCLMPLQATAFRDFALGFTTCTLRFPKNAEHLLQLISLKTEAWNKKERSKRITLGAQSVSMKPSGCTSRCGTVSTTVEPCSERQPFQNP